MNSTSTATKNSEVLLTTKFWAYFKVNLHLSNAHQLTLQAFNLEVFHFSFCCFTSNSLRIHTQRRNPHALSPC